MAVVDVRLHVGDVQLQRLHVGQPHHAVAGQLADLDGMVAGVGRQAARAEGAAAEADGAEVVAVGRRVLRALLEEGDIHQQFLKPLWGDARGVGESHGSEARHAACDERERDHVNQEEPAHGGAHVYTTSYRETRDARNEEQVVYI